MIRVIHGADFHLDAPFVSLPPDRAAQRRREQRELLYTLVELAQRGKADLVLLAGDLFDGEQVYGETLEALEDALGQIGCPVFLAPGNHDFWAPHSPYAAAEWPKNVHIFTGAAPEAVELPELGCVVHGAAFTGPERTDRVLRDFRAPEDGKIHIGLFHGDVSPESKYGPISQEDIAESGLNYLALGHVHTCSGLRHAGKTAWAYPGCPEGRGFDELGDRGVLYGMVEQGKAEMRFLPMCRRRYLIREADITGRTPEEAVAEALPDEVRDDLCRVVLTGERGTGDIDMKALEKLAAGRCYCCTFRDRTRAHRDLWARAGENTLTGLFLQEMHRRLEEAADENTREQVELAVRFGLAALENREDPK